MCTESAGINLQRKKQLWGILEICRTLQVMFFQPCHGFFPKLFTELFRALPPCLCRAPAGCSRVSRRRRPSPPPWSPPRDPGGQTRTCAAAWGRCSRPPGGGGGEGPRAPGPAASFSEKCGGPPPHRGRPCRPPSGRDGRLRERMVSRRPICKK